MRFTSITKPQQQRGGLPNYLPNTHFSCWASMCEAVMRELANAPPAPPGISPHAYERMLSCIRTVVAGDNRHLDFSSCDHDVIFALSPNIANALVLLLNREDAELTLPAIESIFPPWVFSLDRIKRVNIQFHGDPLDLSPWKRNDSPQGGPIVNVSARYTASVVKPDAEGAGRRRTAPEPRCSTGRPV